VDALIDERTTLELEHNALMQRFVNLLREIGDAKSPIDSAKKAVAEHLLKLTDIKADIKLAEAKPPSETCYACGQSLPADKLAANEAKQRNQIKALNAMADERKADIEDYQREKRKHEDNLNALLNRQAELLKELKIAEAAKNKRIEEINEKIKNRPEPDPSKDSEWQAMTQEITSLQAQIGEPVSKQLETIESEKGLADELLRQMNECLAKADSIKEAGERVVELEGKNRELAQKIADCEKQLDEIKNYTVAQAGMVEAAINGLFTHVTFRLFDYYQKGDIDDRVCEAVLDGVAYSDMSTGQKIACGIDCINALSMHYGVSMPLFIDHAESMTLPIEAEGQVIKLRAVKGVKELQVTLEASEEKERKIA